MKENDWNESNENESYISKVIFMRIFVSGDIKRPTEFQLMA